MLLFFEPNSKALVWELHIGSRISLYVKAVSACAILVWKFNIGSNVVVDI